MCCILLVTYLMCYCADLICNRRASDVNGSPFLHPHSWVHLQPIISVDLQHSGSYVIYSDDKFLSSTVFARIRTNNAAEDGSWNCSVALEYLLSSKSRLGSIQITADSGCK